MTQRDDINSKPVKLLMKEAGLSATCLEQGLTSLRRANFMQKWHYYQAFFLLTIGIERLLKIIIITISRIEHNKIPNNQELKNYGHDIENLFAKVSNQINAKDDFLAKDPIYSSILRACLNLLFESYYSYKLCVFVNNW